MSKANPSRRHKLLYNVFHSNLSASDKVIHYAMHLKYVDGEQLLEFLNTNPSVDAVKEYVVDRMKENRVKKDE